jgi:hypothetical protein
VNIRVGECLGRFEDVLVTQDREDDLQ